MQLRLLVHLFFAFLILNELPAQVQYLQLSPTQTITQRVGATNVSVEYSRPQMRKREIFGKLVPYGRMWRTGANKNTTIEFDHRVRIAETEVAAGKYALFTEPNSTQWKIFLYKDTDNYDVPNPLDNKKLIYLATIPSFTSPQKVEMMTMNFYGITETKAVLKLEWENTIIDIPITFYTQEAMEKMIKKELDQNIYDYSITANYYYEHDMELEKAKKLQEIVMELKDKTNARDHHTYGVILEKLKENNAARAQIQKSLDLARIEKNNDLVAKNMKLLTSIKEEKEEEVKEEKKEEEVKPAEAAEKTEG